MQCIAFDAHKRYTWALVEDERGKVVREERVDHRKGALIEFLSGCEPGSPVAVETIGNWYWIADEIEATGMVPRLVHAGKAKGMSGSINKTDKLDVRGINRLQWSIGSGSIGACCASPLGATIAGGLSCPPG